MAITLNDPNEYTPRKYEVWGEDMGVVLLYGGESRDEANDRYEWARKEFFNSLITMRAYFEDDKFLLVRCSRNEE